MPLMSWQLWLAKISDKLRKSESCQEVEEKVSNCC